MVKQLKKMDFRFVLLSDESVMIGEVNLTKYKIVDFIFGEEKKTSLPKYKDQIEFEVFPISLREKITTYLNGGGKIFLSGAYLGTDLYSNPDSSGIRFANDVLKFKLKTGHAVKTGKVFSVTDNFYAIRNAFEFNTTFNDSIYKVEAPDELGEVKGSEVLLRYGENNFSCAIGYKEKYGVVAFGFPFRNNSWREKDRIAVMKSVLNYLELK